MSRGAFSEVWRAVDATGALVAVKRGHGLQAEATAFASFEHPNVVRVLETVVDGDGVAIVMALAEGGSLEELLARRHRLEPAEAVALLAPLADALGSAHRSAVVHGDVKPANVLLDADGTPKLADFGAARHPAITGSAAFVDPRLLATGRPEPSNDIYSLAVVAYRALSGTLPHRGGTDDQVLAAARRGDHPSLLERPDIPRALAAVVEGALALDPRDRPASAEQFAAALRESVGAGSTTRTFGPPPRRFQPEPDRAPDRRAAVIGLAVAAALVLAGLTLGLAVTRHRSPPPACPRLGPLTVPAGARELRGDLSGDGCPVPVVWDGTVMQFRLAGDAEPRRYAFRPQRSARRSGTLLLGDWDCDGADSPAFYDPTTGRVHYFRLVPRSGELSSVDGDTTGIEHGLPRVVHTKRCDRVRVRPAA
jgi:hypothetical protein